MCASARNVIIPHPTPPHPIPWCCVAPTMCASARNVIIPHPTPPHPIPWCCVAATMCASTRKMMLRSTDHVCKCKERYHPPPHPTPPHPMMLRSTDHVCTCKERYHPPPHPTMWIPGKPPVPRVNRQMWISNVTSWENEVNRLCNCTEVEETSNLLAWSSRMMRSAQFHPMAPKSIPIHDFLPVLKLFRGIRSHGLGTITCQRKVTQWRTPSPKYMRQGQKVADFGERSSQLPLKHPYHGTMGILTLRYRLHNHPHPLQNQSEFRPPARVYTLEV